MTWFSSYWQHANMIAYFHSRYTTDSFWKYGNDALMKWVWNSHVCFVLSQGATLRLWGTLHLEISTVITSSAPRLGLVVTVFYEMPFPPHLYSWSVKSLECILQVWWNVCVYSLMLQKRKKMKERISLDSNVSWKKLEQKYKNYTHYAVVLFKKISRKKVNVHIVPFIIYCTNNKSLGSQPVTQEGSPAICIFNTSSPPKSLQFL